MTPHRVGGHAPPGAGGYEVEIGEVTGTPVYHMRMPTRPGAPDALTYGPAPDFGGNKRPRSTVPLIPPAAAVARLPRTMREAFAARCALRLPPGVVVPAEVDVATFAARALLEAATFDSPLTEQLRCIRRDFARLRAAARALNWADDTPVPADALGPLWPPGVAPPWADAGAGGASDGTAACLPTDPPR